MRNYEKKLILIIPLILIILGILFLLFQNLFSFSEDRWHNMEINNRQLIANDFIKKYSDKNLSKDDLIKILGEATGYSRLKTNTNLVYDFGAKKQLFSASNIALIIEFDDENIAISYEIITYSW